jgi:hypothetical protein
MAYASITYTSASGTTFALTNSNGDPIEYLRQADIYVYVNTVLKTLTTDYTFNTAGTAIVLNTAVSGATVTLERITAIAEPTVVYTAGSTLTAQDLNNADNQIRFGLQEFQDDVAGGQGVTDGDKGDITVTGTGTSWTVDSANSGNVVFSSNQIKSVSLGSAAAPTYSFNGDTNTGIFSPGADTLAFAEGGVEAMRINASGNVVMAGTLTTAAQSIAKASLPTGSVLQVITGSTSTQVTNSTSTYTDTGLTATITPLFSTSKILILTQIQGLFKSSDDNSNRLSLRLFRDATALDTADGVLFTSGTSIYLRTTYGHSYYDAPSTTSATTYKRQFMNTQNTASVAVQKDSNAGTSQIILMEIAV